MAKTMGAVLACVAIMIGILYWGMKQQDKRKEFEQAAIQTSQALEQVQESQEKNTEVRDKVEDDSKDITRRIVELERDHVRRSLNRWAKIQPVNTVSDAEMDEIDEAINEK